MPESLRTARPGRWRRAVLAVFRKEMREALRDRRTVLAAIVLPAITMPLVALVAPALFQRQQQALRERPIRVALEDVGVRALTEAAALDGGLRILTPGDPSAALLRGEIDAVVGRRAAPEPVGRLVVFYDESQPASAAAAGRVAGMLARAAQRRPGPGSGPGGQGTDVPPVELLNVASPTQMGRAVLASALPLFLTVWVLLGGQHAALDVGVGERERGTLEALLTLPAPRSALVVGKFLAVLGPAVIALVVTLGAGVVSLYLGAPLLAAGPARLALPPSVVLAVLAVGAALAALLSAAQLAVSLAARTLREAQQAFTGLYLATAMPATLMPLAGDLLERPWIRFVPVVDAVWAVRGLLARGIGLWDLLLVVGVLVGFAVPLLWLGTRLAGSHRGSIRR